MPYKDPKAQREYQRRWKAERRAKWFRNKVCAKCGSEDKLELDHQDRTLKESHKIWTWSESRRLIELAKCQILCRKCHEIKTSQEMGYRQHGTQWSYSTRGCRCDLCKEAHRIVAKKYRQK